MASKKSASSSKPAVAAKPAAAPKVAPKATASTPVRHTAIPKASPIAAVAAVAQAAPAARAAVTSDAISRRAYEIWSAEGGCEVGNWLRAESELRAA